jgi:hypothetical protein
LQEVDFGFLAKGEKVRKITWSSMQKVSENFGLCDLKPVFIDVYLLKNGKRETENWRQKSQENWQKLMNF